MSCWRNPERFQHRAGPLIHHPLAISKAHCWGARHCRAAGKSSTILEHVWLERARVPAAFQPLQLLPALARACGGGADGAAGRAERRWRAWGGGRPSPKPLGLLTSGPRRRAGLCRRSRPLAPCPGRDSAAPAAALPLPPPAHRPRAAAPALSATDAVRAAPAPTWRQRGAEQRGAIRAASGWVPAAAPGSAGRPRGRVRAIARAAPGAGRTADGGGGGRSTTGPKARSQRG